MESGGEPQLSAEQMESGGEPQLSAEQMEPGGEPKLIRQSGHYSLRGRVVLPIVTSDNARGEPIWRRG